jgi:hypothetical protein
MVFQTLALHCIEEHCTKLELHIVLRLGMEKMALTTHYEKKLVTKCHKGPQTWTDSLHKCPELKKMDIRFGKWNVRSLHMAGSLITFAKEISKYKLDLAAVQEIRWDGGGTEPASELYGKENENDDSGTGLFCT